MRRLTQTCHVGVLSTFERSTITAKLTLLFSGTRGQFFIVPICNACHRRFALLNQDTFKHHPEFEML
jgi:hypothetical protein